MAIGLTGCGHDEPDRPGLSFELPPDSLSLPVENRSVGILRYDADGRTDTLYLQSAAAEHTWRITMQELLAGIDYPADSLSLRMFVAGRDSDEGACKEDMIRTLAVADLFDEEITLTYNQPWPLKKAYPLRFEVDMNNQKVLGFFKPEEGDEVTVTGSWCGWCDLSLYGMRHRIVGKLKWSLYGKTTRQKRSRYICSYGLMGKALRPAQK